MSLTLKAINRQNSKLHTSINGEKMLEVKDDLLKSIQDNVNTNDIVVGQWKRVGIELKGQKKMVMKIVDCNKKKDEFIEHVTTQIGYFEEYVTRIKHQYKEMKKLKENLPDNHCIIHMDFSENYACKSLQEIQSAYWNQTSVTLHPIVVYFKLPNSQELQHRSYVIVSDEMSHCAATVLTMIDKLVSELMSLIPNMACLHYWTDSPTSQYRNKAIFNAIANHEASYGMRAKWNYWEAGHGKGPCDGLGGTCKRMADAAVKTGKVVIQDPADFFAWTQSPCCNMKNVIFFFISTDSCQQKVKELSKLSLKPVSGTMKIHAVVGKGNSEIYARNTSCYCDVCLYGDSTCDTWRLESLTGVQKCTSELIQQTTNALQIDKYSVDDYVAVVYLNQWYIGTIKNVDNQDNEVKISFLAKKKALFKWPSRPDVIWVGVSSILCKIAAPTPSGKSKRMLVLKKDEILMIEHLFSNFKAV